MFIDKLECVLDWPWHAGTAELVWRAGGRADLIWTITTVILVVTHPLGGDATPPGTGKLRFQTGRGDRRASHTLTLPHTILTGTGQTQAKKALWFMTEKKKNGIYFHKHSNRLTSSGSVEWQYFLVEKLTHPTHMDTEWELHSSPLLSRKHSTNYFIFPYLPVVKDNCPEGGARRKNISLKSKT